MSCPFNLVTISSPLFIFYSHNNSASIYLYNCFASSSESEGSISSKLKFYTAKRCYSCSKEFTLCLSPANQTLNVLERRNFVYKVTAFLRVVYLRNGKLRDDFFQSLMNSFSLNFVKPLIYP